MIHVTSGSVPGLLVLTLKEVKMGGERFTNGIKYLFVRYESGNLEKAAISSAAQHLHKKEVLLLFDFCSGAESLPWHKFCHFTQSSRFCGHAASVRREPDSR